MRVLVTGYKGYVGTVLVPMLLAEGFDVTGIDSGLFEDCTFGEEEPNQGSLSSVRHIRKDIREIDSSDLKNIDSIVHLAALSNDPLSDLNPEITYQINHKASVKLAELAKASGIKRFVFSSSCSIYGAAGLKMATEESVLNPLTPYGLSKMLSEQDISKLADSNFSPTFLRSATAYGLSRMLRFDVVLNNLVAWAYTTGCVRLKSDGTAWRPIVHVEDMSLAFIAALKAPVDKIHNQAFNVGRTSENYKVREIAEIVKDTVPGSKLEFAGDAEPDKRSYRVDFSKIDNTLKDFKPKWTVRMGAQQLYEAYKKFGVTLEEFEGPKYRRISHLQNGLKSGVLDETIRRRDL